MPRNLSETRGRSTKLRTVWCGGAISPCRGSRSKLSGILRPRAAPWGRASKPRTISSTTSSPVTRRKYLSGGRNCQHFGGERKEGRPVRAFREKAEGRREFSVQCLPQTTLHLQVHLLRDRKCGKENKDLVPFLVSALLTIVSKEVKTWLFVSAHIHDT